MAIPAEVQRQLGLERRQNNHVLHFSIRTEGTGRWNSHWAQLNSDNEFAIPTNVTEIEAGARVEVKIHGAVAAIDVLEGTTTAPLNPGGLLLDLADAGEEDARTDGSVNLDEYLRRA